MRKYKKRIIDEEIQNKLNTFGAVLLVGPKWSGKTTTASHLSKSIIEFQNPDKKASYVATANIKPSLLLNGDKPLLIDEWQEIPNIWDAVRYSIDKTRKNGLYILTGSTSVDDKLIMHTGIGRISRQKMYTMSLFESEESNGTISLALLFNNNKLNIDGIKSSLTIEELIFAACRGGWPQIFNVKNDNSKLLIAKDYFNNIVESDISTVDGIKRSPRLTNAILSTYARNISTLAKKTTMQNDIIQNVESIDIKTFDSYVNALEKLFVIEDVEAWCPEIRSKTAIRSTHKKEFTDPSIAVAALGVLPEYFLTDLLTFGFIFECLCIRDLRIYSQKLNGKLSYYRDRNGLEADCVLHLQNGKYALIEFKLGNKEIDEGAKHLNNILSLIKKHNIKEKNKINEPSFLMVITGGEMAYKRNDGVLVVPIGCLKD